MWSEHPTTNIEHPTSNGRRQGNGSDCNYSSAIHSPASRPVVFEKEPPKITIGFWPGIIVYTASAFFGSGWGRVNGSTIFNVFRYYVTASESARGCHVGRQTKCAQTL